MRSMTSRRCKTTSLMWKNTSTPTTITDPLFFRIMNRQQLLETYIEEIIDGMDHKTMYQYVYDNLYDHLNNYGEEELKNEVEEYYPHLLEPSISELEATASDYGVGK